MEVNRQAPSANKYLQCFLCEQSCLQPRLCPKCTKAFCNHCLNSALTSFRSPQCPSCELKVRHDEFLSTQVVNGIVEQVTESVRKQQKRNQERQVCKQHNLTMNYFCLDCNIPLCSDCGMLSNNHKTHKFVSFRDIYQRIKAKLFQQFPRFDRRIKQLLDKKEELRTKIDNLHNDYRRYKKYFQQAFIRYTQKVDQQAKILQQRITLRQENNNQRLHQLQSLRDNIYDEMQTKTQLSLIRQAQSLAQSIQALTSKQYHLGSSSSQNVELQELSEITPEYTTWDYSLKDFSSRSGIVFSDVKKINGIEWRLKIYPRGNGLARDKYISVFVEMTNGLISQNKYEYRIQMVNQLHPEQSVKRQYCSTFEIGECWGYNQFQPLDQLIVKDFIVDNTLIFKIGIRNRTYRSLALQKACYIEHLLNKSQNKQMEVLQKEQEIERFSEKSTTLQKIKQYLQESKKSLE